MSRHGYLVLILLLPLIGCVQLSDRLEDVRLQEGLNQEFHRLNPELPMGRFARHFERGWKQGLYDTRYGSVSRNSNTTYMASRYEFGRGAVEKDAWESGYQIGSQAYPKPEIEESVSWQQESLPGQEYGHTIDVKRAVNSNALHLTD